MKIYGNYYKATKDGKRKADFDLEVEEGNLTEARRQADSILKAKDTEFRGVRELHFEKGEEKAIYSHIKIIRPLVSIGEDLFYLELINVEAPFIYEVGEKVEEVKTDTEQTNNKKTFKEIRQLAKSKGIRNWHNKKIDNLIKEIEAINDNDK